MAKINKINKKPTTLRSTKNKNTTDLDSIYFLKLVVVLILGSLWLKLGNGQTWQLPLPVGMIGGMSFIKSERLKNDRKIMYGVLLVAMLVGFWAPFGIFINI